MCDLEIGSTGIPVQLVIVEVFFAKLVLVQFGGNIRIPGGPG